jgi:ATP-dependent DNA ligase I
MRFAELVATSDSIATTRARSQKIAEIADVLRRADDRELPVAVAVLMGEPRQRKVGVGWRTLSQLEVPPAPEPELEILDVDAAFERLASIGGPGSQATRAAALDELWRRATDAEQSFLLRLLVGELRQGALAGIVTDAVAKAADVPLAAVRRAAMFAGNLPKVAVIARSEGVDGLGAVRLRVLNPVLPMLAQSAETVAEALEVVGGTASVEWKLDGARLQIHRSDDEVRIYTRSLREITARLPGIAALVRSFPAHHLVLDAEAVGWTEGAGGDGDDAPPQPQAFQDLMSSLGRAATTKRTEGVVELRGLEARFFDVLHVDGDDLVDRPLRQRLEVLDRIAGRWRIPGRITGDPAEAQAVLDESLDTGHEGVMVKAADSPYEAGRRGGAWRKVKPVKTLDLVVLAVEWGHGRRQGWLSNLHLGARDPDSGEPVMVGKTFKGLTDEMLTWQTERFKELATSPLDDWVVHVRPEQVVEIALDGVQKSPRYPGGVALRFARVRHYRPDKSADEADTIQTVQAMLPGA